MRNSHLVPACHRSLDLLSSPTPLVLPLSFPLFLLLLPLRGVVCRLTFGSARPSASDPNHRTRSSLADDAAVSMETGYVTPGDGLRRDLGIRLFKRGRSVNGDLGEVDLEHRYLEIRETGSLVFPDSENRDLEKYDLKKNHLEKYDLERRHLEKLDASADHLENSDLEAVDLETSDLETRDLEKYDLERQHLVKPDPSADHLEDRDLRRHGLENNDLEHHHLNGDQSVHLENDDLDPENSSRSPETSPTDDDVTSAHPLPDRHAYRRRFNSLKLPFRPAPRDVTQSSPRRHHNVTRYRLVFQSRSPAAPPGADVTPGVGSVNLMIIPLGAIFVFIVIGVLHLSRWCIEDIREADGILAKRHLGPGFIASCALPRPPPIGRCSLPAVDRLTEGGSGRSGGANSDTDLARLHTRARIQRQTRIVPARSTRSLNGIRDRNCERANRKLAIGSDSSIPMTEMTSSAVRYCRHADRGGRATSGADGIVESCKRAVGSFLQSHVIVVPVDRNMATGCSAAATRSRNFSSPAPSSKTGSSCSESRPLLAHCSSSSDGRMTSSDSNIDVMSPLSVRRRLAGETRYRTKPSCVNSAGNLVANRIVAVQHGRHPVGGGRAAGYSHQSSAPAVSKLVHESLNLSFRFFQVPLCSDPSSSSAKESLDSVFVCGIYADDVTPTVATPTSASDAHLLRPELEIYSAASSEHSCKLRHHQQPRSSRERAPHCSVFDRQSSIGEEDGVAAKMVRESSQTLHEGPELDLVRFRCHLGDAQPESSLLLALAKGCRGNRGDNFRRAKSATELQVLSVKDKRSAKCLTA